jgi:hypothetical protein
VVLSAAQRTLFDKARRLGAGAQGVGLDDATSRALILLAARDLGRADAFSDALSVPELYDADPPETLRSESGPPPLEMFDRLVETCGHDADTYFSSLASLQKARMKYRRILATQPSPTVDQVGPRGLLEYGLFPTSDLAALLFWRKWMFDIDNRAGQQTGYLFEPIIAASIGGVPASAARSPIKRRSGNGKGRQVDCLHGDDAYELKLRVTKAASGQGRWSEELAFPEDARASGYTPVLVVFDPTEDPKLSELAAAFTSAGGRVYVGDAAWAHLEEAAGATMGAFLEKYVRAPLQDLLESASEELPELTLSLNSARVVFTLGAGARYEVQRDRPDLELVGGGDELPEEVEDTLPGL